ncbi:MAG: helix-turn-helix domain-containing protein [Candidatus Dormibacteraceae bacterium]
MSNSMTGGLEAADQKMADRNLIKLEAAARQLDCHVETLRIRIRSGQLKAYRGAHGAYYIRADSLQRLLEQNTRRLRTPTARDLELAWRKSRLRLGEELARKRVRDEPRHADIERRWEAGLIEHYSAIQRVDQLPEHYEATVQFLQVLKADPSMHRPIYRLMLGQGLGSLGFRATQVAPILGVSARQARRLIRKREIATPVFRAARHWAPRRAQRLVDELRLQLLADGTAYHRLVSKRSLWWDRFRREGPRPAFMTKKLKPDETMGLHRAGLSDEQIWAITVAGIGADELNQLLLRGAR